MSGHSARLATLAAGDIGALVAGDINAAVAALAEARLLVADAADQAVGRFVAGLDRDATIRALAGVIREHVEGTRSLGALEFTSQARMASAVRRLVALVGEPPARGEAVPPGPPSTRELRAALADAIGVVGLPIAPSDAMKFRDEWAALLTRTETPT